MDVKTRKILTMFGGFHMKGTVGQGLHEEEGWWPGVDQCV